VVVFADGKWLKETSSIWEVLNGDKGTLSEVDELGGGVSSHVRLLLVLEVLAQFLIDILSGYAGLLWISFHTFIKLWLHL